LPESSNATENDIPEDKIRFQRIVMTTVRKNLDRFFTSKFIIFHKETVELFGIVLILKIVVEIASSMLEELKEIISLRAEKNIAEIHFNRNSKKLHDNKVSVSLTFVPFIIDQYSLITQLHSLNSLAF
jgi:hypothetical protein